MDVLQLFIHSPIGGHLGYLQFEATPNKAIINTAYNSWYEHTRQRYGKFLSGKYPRVE